MTSERRLARNIWGNRMEGGAKPVNHDKGEVDKVRHVKSVSLCDNTTKLDKTIMLRSSSGSIRPELPPRPKRPPSILDIITMYAPPHSGSPRMDGNTKSTPRQVSPVDDPPALIVTQPQGEIITAGIQDPTQAPDPLQAPDPETFAEKWSEIREVVDRIRQDSGINFLIAAYGGSANGNDRDAYRLHATQDLNEAKFLERLRACISQLEDHDTDGIDDRAAKVKTLDLDEQEIPGEVEAEINIVGDLKRLLIKSAKTAGFNILNENGGLMWGTVEDVMAKQGIYLDNYPYILMPHEKRQTKGKGIQNLQTSERKQLMSALCSQVNQCRFIRLPNAQQNDIKNSKHPLIIFAPPSADSQHEKGMRYFKSGKKDWMGHPRPSLDLASSDEVPDENNTIGKRRIVSEGLESKSEIRDTDSRVSSEYESMDGESEEQMPSKSKHMKQTVSRIDNYEYGNPESERSGQSSRARCGGPIIPRQDSGAAGNGKQTASCKHPDGLGLKSTRKRRFRSATNHERSRSGDSESNLKRSKPRRVAFAAAEQWSDTETPRQKNQGPVPSHTGQNPYQMHEGSHKTIDEGWNQYRLPDGAHPYPFYPPISAMPPFSFLPGNTLYTQFTGENPWQQAGLSWQAKGPDWRK